MVVLGMFLVSFFSAFFVVMGLFLIRNRSSEERARSNLQFFARGELKYTERLSEAELHEIVNSPLVTLLIQLVLPISLAVSMTTFFQGVGNSWWNYFAAFPAFVGVYTMLKEAAQATIQKKIAAKIKQINEEA